MRIFNPPTHSFTLVELLITVGILSILAVAIFIVVNPVEYLKQARDSKRIQDLASIHKSIQILEALDSGLFLGTSTVVYVSIPDSSVSCSNLGLPPISGYTYRCVSSSTLKNTDGSGWIPIDFMDFSGVLRLSVLPVDPVNATSTGNYYMYTPGGSYELATIFESSKYRVSGDKDKTSKDGGDNYSMYEVGSNLTLLPQKDSGLVGWWRFDEGSGVSAVDSSENNHRGTLINGATYAVGKFGYALSLDGANDYVDIATTTEILPDVFTVSAWVKLNGGDRFCVTAFSYTSWPAVWYKYSTQPLIFMTPSTNYRYFAKTDFDTDWHYITFTVPGNNTGDLLNSKLYLDGEIIPHSSGPDSGVFTAKSALVVGKGSGYYAKGMIDDLRIYNRVLSEAEIKTIYFSGK